MSVDTVTDPAVRPPRQARSRAAWDRVLDVGTRLLESGGYEALKVSDVCREADVSPPAIYARVDGRSGLFLAVYERSMQTVHATEDDAFAGLDGSTGAAIAAAAHVFEVHGALLRAVTRHAASDPDLLARGAVQSRRFARRLADAMTELPPETAWDLARNVYAECSFRAMYGPCFWTDRAESTAEFVQRLSTLALHGRTDRTGTIE